MRIKHFNIEIGTQLFQACADTARLRILSLILTNGEMCISDLEKILDFTQSKTARHISYLKNAGIVHTHKYNQWVYYSIKEEVLDVIKQFLQFVQRDAILLHDQEIFHVLFTNRELALAEYRRLKK